MRIGLAGPVQMAGLRPWLGDAELPAGMGGTPVTLLARALLRAGREVVLVTLDPAVGEEVIVDGRALRVCVLPWRPAHRGRDGYRAERAHLEHALRRESPEVVHAHWSYEYALAAVASGLPALVTVHDWAPTIMRHQPDGYRAARLVMNMRALYAAPLLTAPSPYIAERLRRWRRRAIVIPNGLEDESFDPVPRCPPRDEPLLVAVSDGFTRWKNVHALLLAHARLPAGRLELIGWDYEPGGLAEQWARARGLGERVTFAGSMSHSDVLERIRAADVLVHPSLEESFGMVVLEALARGTPVVAGARSGAVPWLLDGGRVGELVDVTDPAALAAGVERLLADGGRWEERSRAGHAHAWEHFRMSQVASAYLEAYGGVSVA